MLDQKRPRHMLMMARNPLEKGFGLFESGVTVFLVILSPIRDVSSQEAH